MATKKKAAPVKAAKGGKPMGSGSGIAAEVVEVPVVAEVEPPVAEAGSGAPAEAAGRAAKLRPYAAYAFRGTDIRGDIREKYGFDGDLLELYASGTERVINKWHHYLPLYDRYFARWRNRPFRFLEIGVSKGGSLDLWRRYFGPEAVIFGIDIDPKCAAFDGISGQVRIGSQDDPAFLARVVEEMGGVDVVLDDGSHLMPHVHKTFEVLFPKLSYGGTYMIEDLHTAYLRRYGGGFRSGENFFNFARRMVDDMHRWYHTHGERRPDLGPDCSGIHIHDSVAVFDKDRPFAPTHSRVAARGRA
ncbi:class I SAM-dependent methyltransferase [Tabrizicola sp. M-4]|uniref:class I SAM-dependent methyltransferase n=1 Tax=Tabrizicola sp. M-4 TaxID=3055847 RepID=UPI003DAA0CB4